MGQVQQRRNHVRTEPHFSPAPPSRSALSLPAQASDPELTVFDWSGFENQALIEPYVAKYGDMPTYALFGDDDEAFQKLTSGFKADVAHPCSQMIQKYRDAGVIEPWDVSQASRISTKIDPRFLNSKIFKDDAGVWFIPTDYAYTAIAYNTTDVPAEDVASLDVFTNPKYEGRISLPDNADDVWALALLATGVTDWTTVTDEQFNAAADWLRKVNPTVKAYWSDPSQLSQLMASGEVQVAWAWNDSIALLRSAGLPGRLPASGQRGARPHGSAAISTSRMVRAKKTRPMISSTPGWMTARPRACWTTSAMPRPRPSGMAKIIDPAELKAADVDPIDTTLLAQTPLDPALRDRMVHEFEQIKSGF